MLVRFDLRELEDELGAATMEIAEEVAVELTNQLRIEAPVGATGRLQDSFQLFRTEDGVVWLGTRVPYAKGVWKGRPPHQADFDSLQVWARRVVGSEDAAGPIWRHIAREGTEPNDYVGRAVDNTMQRVGQMRFDQL